MDVKHLPDGSFKDILAGRNTFPTPTIDEWLSLGKKYNIQWIDGKPEVANLRNIREFSPYCDHADAISEFLGIPPLRLYWYPFSTYLSGFLTPCSNSILLLGDIENIWPEKVDALIGHEAGHGIQGRQRTMMSYGGQAAEYYAQDANSNLILLE